VTQTTFFTEGDWFLQGDKPQPEQTAIKKVRELQISGDVGAMPGILPGPEKEHSKYPSHLPGKKEGLCGGVPDDRESKS